MEVFDPMTGERLDINPKTLEVTNLPQCITGCKHFTGGDVRHHKDCPFYAESLTYLLDRQAAEIDRLSILCTDWSNKLCEWQERTECSCPTGAAQHIASLREGRNYLAAELEAKHTELVNFRNSLRPAIQWFAYQMELRLSQNDHKQNLPRPAPEECKVAILGHLEQLMEHCQIDQSTDAVQKHWHAAHIGNWLLMLIGKDVNRKL